MADIQPSRELFIGDTPMLDARAPVEFGKGAFPMAVNLPLMNDDERHQVGIRYKEQGQQSAIELGHQLVGGALKEARIQAWADFARAHPEGCLYCFRGGLRSGITQQWLKSEAGIAYPRVAGGYKAMRHFLMDAIEHAVAGAGFVVVGGMTGCGKTDVLAQLDNALDLEAYANHRGSSFGRHATPQPAPIDFEHRLAIALLKQQARGHHWFALEDESRLIGACALPLSLHQGMQKFPMVWLEDSRAGRVERILRDYVVGLCAEYLALDAEHGFARYREHLLAALGKLQKRLGDERYRRLNKLMEDALARQEKDGAVDLHRAWIETLLSEYYDPMYEYQRESRRSRLLFAGNQSEVVDFLRNYQPA
ncbi:tRNA 2-selenouridine(34) synthase MnmH [Herbaspirillum sp. LeCh32-8]|uniref:tRNA 2-selenouridine(34) synthase MnmH n=1 Tax=Herbaspirillum sp. LeCh32-8 TaxID=2821356 RepID=UPI001AEA1AEF|nr:tRNA 2-selenouridine(34) synthase MnmH [Herbaspirillum sp. LeCh32-8]MBP0596564.1 tRNA 2-selenouridine(34) synthase MnmH [Herbaspirillum sp. LeCh32-8]